MNDRYDGSSIDLERALVRVMAERRMSRRTVLEAMAKLGVSHDLMKTRIPVE